MTNIEQAIVRTKPMTVDKGLCIGCEACTPYECPWLAISMGADGKAFVDPAKCVGVKACLEALGEVRTPCEHICPVDGAFVRPDDVPPCPPRY